MSLEHRLRELETKFEKTTGHKHTGGGGDAPILPGGGFTFSCTATGLTWTSATGVLSLTALYAIPLATDTAKGVSAYGVMHTQNTDVKTNGVYFIINWDASAPTDYSLTLTTAGLTGDYQINQTKLSAWDLAYTSIHAAVSLGASHGSLSLAGQVLSWDGVSTSCSGVAASCSGNSGGVTGGSTGQVYGASGWVNQSALSVGTASAAGTATTWATANSVGAGLAVSATVLGITANGVAYSMMQNVAQYSILGRTVAGTGNLAEITSLGAGTKYLRDDLTWQTVTGSMLALPNGQVYVGKADGSGAAAVAMSADVTIVASGAATIAAQAVTVAKMYASATSKIFGRKTAAAGAGEELSGADVLGMMGTDGSGSSGYFKLGNMMIQWGHGDQAFANQNSVNMTQITYPQAFKNGTTPRVTITVNHLGAVGNVIGMINNDNTATTLGITLYIGNASNQTGTVNVNWIAVGQWQ
jgi:hypothetical protein